MLNRILYAAMSVAVLFIAQSAEAVIPISVSLESEKPGLQTTTSGVAHLGVEDFDAGSLRKTSSFVTDFGTGDTIIGKYSAIEVRKADVYGGANGKGQYAVTFDNDGYALDLSTKLAGGVTYFGFWLSALDIGNNVSFYQAGKRLFTFTAADAKNFIDALANRDSYYGNPNLARDRNAGEPYAFLNFYAEKGTAFDRIVFAEYPQKGGYESDNHSVGQWTRKSGTMLPVTDIVPGGVVGAVPEPRTWMMMVAGFAMVGYALRRRAPAAAPQG